MELLTIEFTFLQLLLHAPREGLKVGLSPAQLIKEFLIHFAAVKLFLQAFQSQTGGASCIVDFGVTGLLSGIDTGRL